MQRIKAIDKEHFAKLDKMHSTQVMEAQKVQKLMQSAQEEKIEKLMEKSKLYSSKSAQAKMLRQTQIEEKEKLALS